MTETEETIKILDKICDWRDNSIKNEPTWFIESAPPKPDSGQSVFVFLTRFSGEFYFCDHTTFRSGFAMLEHMAGFSDYVARKLAEPMEIK